MPILITEHAGKRWTTPINGRVWIGRDADCQIIINHPIVSRQHAWVESADEESIRVGDNNSRNGTLIAGERVADPRQLRDGDIFQIGPATIAYHAREPELEIDAPSVDAGEVAGIIFRCECGASLWAPRGAAGSKTICPKCHRSVRCPGELPPPPTRHQVCGVCQWKIEPHEESTTCPACGVAYHADCWIGNHGCAAYGCSQSNVLAEKSNDENGNDATSAEITGTTGEPSGSAAGPETGAKLTDPPVVPAAIEIPMLAAAILGSILGLIGFGAPAFVIAVIAFAYMLVRRGRARMILLIAGITGLLGTVAGLLASLYWWMGITPMNLIGK